MRKFAVWRKRLQTAMSPRKKLWRRRLHATMRTRGRILQQQGPRVKLEEALADTLEEAVKAGGLAEQLVGRNLLDAASVEDGRQRGPLT